MPDAVSPPGSDANAEQPIKPGGESGIGGWLLLFVVGQVAALLFRGGDVVYPFSNVFRGDWEAGIDWPVYRTAIVVSALHSLTWAAGSAIGLVLILRRDRRCPSFYRAYLLTLAALGAIGLVTSWYGLGEIIQDLGDVLLGSLKVSELQQQDLVESGRGVAVTLIWYLYWARSVRVANTFPGASPVARG